MCALTFAVGSPCVLLSEKAGSVVYHTGVRTVGMVLDDAPDSDASESDGTVVFDRVVDWAVGALLGLVGVLGVLGGAVLYYGITRPGVAHAIRSGEFHSDVLTEAEAIDMFVAFGRWTGLGLVVTGLLIASLGVAVVVVHGRARRAGRPTPVWIVGLVGASVATVLGFVPFAPVLGGAVSGYLNPNRTAHGFGIGAIAGVFGSLPLLVVGAFTSFGLLVSGPGEVAAGVAVLFVVTVLISLVYFVVLSALGGYLGGWVRDR